MWKEHGQENAVCMEKGTNIHQGPVCGACCVLSILPVFLCYSFIYLSLLQLDLLVSKGTRWPLQSNSKDKDDVEKIKMFWLLVQHWVALRVLLPHLIRIYSCQHTFINLRKNPGHSFEC